MNGQQQLNYTRIAEAIDYIKNNFKEQPNLDEVAEQVHLSPFHFQRWFVEWAGIQFWQLCFCNYSRWKLVISKMII
tara:strand:- start:216 stop:443 length:228 start_codon:yes stop_codon:yes gene_type:complete